MKEIKCPSCGSTNVEAFDDTRCRCPYCGTIFLCEGGGKFKLPQRKKTETRTEQPSFDKKNDFKKRGKSLWGKYWYWILACAICVTVIAYKVSKTPKREKMQNYSYEEIVNNKTVSGEENGYEWVDLGLPSGTLWANCNIGAHNPVEDGEYYAWGETEAKFTYDRSTYRWLKGKKYTKYCIDSEYGDVDDKIELEKEDDAAHAIWGGKWSVPTRGQCLELLHECCWFFSGELDVSGYIVYKAKAKSDKGRLISNSHVNKKLSGEYSLSDPHIFLPMAGHRVDDGVKNDNEGMYMTKTLGERTSCISVLILSPTIAYEEKKGFGGASREYGMSIRPVITRK